MSKSSVVLLPYRSASVAAARWRLAAELRDAGIADPAVSDASLVLTELLSNAILHASPLGGTTLRVTWALAEGCVEVAVSDGGGDTEPQAQHPPPSATGGRGLAIVEHLSQYWGVHISDHGTTVWAVMPAPGGGTSADGAPADGTSADGTSMDGGLGGGTPAEGTTPGGGAPVSAPLAGVPGDQPAPACEG